MYSTIPIHWYIKSAPASPGRSRAGPSLYVFSLLVHNQQRSAKELRDRYAQGATADVLYTFIKSTEHL
jgi:hypothetical protein